jgi:hypothetical protein
MPSFLRVVQWAETVAWIELEVVSTSIIVRYIYLRHHPKACGCTPEVQDARGRFGKAITSSSLDGPVISGGNSRRRRAAQVFIQRR